MSELKAFVARKIDDGTCDPVPCVEVYLKSEADTVIRHQKFKRCLDKADLCDEKHRRITAYVDDDYETDKEYRQFMSDFWIAWKCKWLKLAEKFKPEGKC